MSGGVHLVCLQVDLILSSFVLAQEWHKNLKIPRINNLGKKLKFKKFEKTLNVETITKIPETLNEFYM